MEYNPLRTISNSCAEMRQLSQALQAARGNSATDVSDVFDISSSILTTILKESAGGVDPNEYIIDSMKKINQILASKEQTFKSKMNLLLSDTSQKVTQISNQLKNSNLDVNYVLENVKKIKDDFIQKKDEENQKILKEFQKNLKEEEENKKKEEKAIYEHFESYLSQVMADITATYNQRLKQSDDLNNNLEIKLQTVVHDKHQQKANRGSIFEQEEKRFLEMQEKLTKEFNEYKSEIEKKILQLKQSIEKLKAEINQNKNSNNLTFQQKENDLTLKQKEKINEINLKIKNLENQLNSLTLKKSDIENNILKTQNEIKDQTSQIIRQHDEEVKKFQQETVQMTEKVEKEIESKFKPKIDDLLNEIKENENKKTAQESQFNDEQNESFKETDKDIQKLKEKNDQKSLVVKTKLSQKKKELRSIQNQRDKDLEKVKNEKVKILASAKQNDEEKVKKRASIINEFMKKFDEAQLKLFERNFITREEMNRRRDLLIKKLEQVELEDIDKIKSDTDFNDKEYQIEIKLLKDEFQDHKTKVNSIQNRIDLSKSRIESLTEKIRAVERSAIRLIEQYIGINDDHLEDDLKKAVKNGFDENLVSRVQTAAYQIEAKTNLLRQEQADVKNSMNFAFDSFEKKMNEFDIQLKSSLNRLRMKEGGFAERRERIGKKISSQKKTIIELEQALSRKSAEVDRFAKTINESKLHFEKETKESFELNLNEASQKHIELQNEIEKIKGQFNSEISKLKEKIEEAKNKTIEISKFQLSERERRKKEEADRLLNLHNKRMKEIESTHNQTMNNLSEKLQNAKNKQKNGILKFNSNFTDFLNAKLAELNQKVLDLEQEKQNLIVENHSLIARYDELKSCPCQECQRKKELIRKLLQAKKSIENQMEQHQEILQKNDQNMNAIFGVKKKQVATPLLDMPKKETHAPVIAKPGSNVSMRAKSQLNQKPSSANSRFHQGVSSALAPSKNPV